ncbi:TonB-dependent receptor plug domain-containing protein [Erythrobacter sp. BLCC-B19]|uniref:TonB-dependent receptor plug domain-containing protein n=1 Tax=Erythrobacter sp. BLCC-B19 TaxID=3025315 RepID=UPI002362CFBD|nr:outer membrane beta-barrel protein [Erythrobacter sp. BLCC-B19]WDA39678.1 outer membrane beta-barrel protein [Erythrobacter sp. BLCC-B19]
MLRTQLFIGSALAALATAPAFATETADPQAAAATTAAVQSGGAIAETDESEDDKVQSAKEIVVQGSIGFRNRSDTAEPVLVYDEEYFQRFEPLTAGDALKRVPGVTFLSDVIESDGARLRGLDPGYTQVLINGERVPGGQADRSFFLDRIPAELIEQVEIVRSSSARRTGDAVAGSLNIKLRDGFALDGGYLRAGGLFFDDGEVKPSGGFYYGGALAGGRVLVGANIQGRYNPKEKSSLRYGDSPENNPNFATDGFDNREDQTDVRDGTDYAFNASWGIETDSTEFEILGNFVRTERTESERSFEYNDPAAINGPVRATPAGNLLTDNVNVNDITTESWALVGKLDQDWGFTDTKLRVGFSRFTDLQDEFEYEVDFDRTLPRFTGDLILQDTTDEEFFVNLEQEFDLGEDLEFAIGGFLQNKDRDFLLQEVRSRFNLTAANRQGYDQFSRTPAEFVPNPFPALGISSNNTIEEDRRDLYALIEGESGNLTFEAGIRWESTDVTITDLQVGGAGVITNDYDEFLPSASVKIEVGDGRITASAARTLRRPRFDFITPGLLEAEFGDNDFLGNPLLQPETAWGGDLGYEHKIGKTGIVGVNVFYRDVSNLTELATLLDATGAPVEGSEGAGTFIYTPRNTGNGEVYGIEFDASFSLAFLGLPDTGVFGNLAILDSNITDEFGERRFNDQSKYVYNFGAIQNIPEYGAAFGATYRKQGAAFGRVVGEEITTRYGADLEVFIEKRFGDSFTIRAVGSNLLDGTKDEVFNKFATTGDQVSRDFDEYELESERAGPVFQVVARYAF